MNNQAKLMKASKWAKREFEEGSIPDTRTIKKWIENGMLKGRVVDGFVLVSSSEQWGVPLSVSTTVSQLICESK